MNDDHNRSSRNADRVVGGEMPTIVTFVTAIVTFPGLEGDVNFNTCVGN